LFVLRSQNILLHIVSRLLSHWRRINITPQFFKTVYLNNLN
jgi:hypothetical protein